MIRELEAAAAETLEDFHDIILSDRQKEKYNVPDDCNVHELNSNTFHFLESIQGKFIQSVLAVKRHRQKTYIF